ncbi:hypothetical protein KEM56_007368, partial [Ascosphaera pollenicola]
KQCYHCQGVGHVQSDCPTLRLQGGAPGVNCYICNLPGHVARTCPRRSGAPAFAARGGFAGGRGGYMGGAMARGGGAAGAVAATTTCYKCGGPNHFARDCQANALKCYACGKLVLAARHISRECPNAETTVTAAATTVVTTATSTDGGIDIAPPSAPPSA